MNEYIYIYIYIYIYTHKSECAEIAYELPLVPNNTASVTSVHKSELCEELQCARAIPVA